MDLNLEYEICLKNILLKSLTLLFRNHMNLRDVDTGNTQNNKTLYYSQSNLKVPKYSIEDCSVVLICI